MTLKEALALQKKNKYHAQKYVSFDGIEHDSEKEGHRWEELLLLQKAGEITDLVRQFPFKLLPGQKIDGKQVEKPVYYYADFVYKENGETVVEDVKSKATKTPEYVIKRKMLLYFYGIKIKET